MCLHRAHQGRKPIPFRFTQARCAGRTAFQALVADTCTSCPPTQINLPYAVFVTNLTRNSPVGTVPIRFRQVLLEPAEILWIGGGQAPYSQYQGLERIVECRSHSAVKPYCMGMTP